MSVSFSDEVGKAMKILYLGDDAGTSAHRLAALRRLGHDVSQIDPWDAIGRSRASTLWLWRFGGVGFERRVRRHVLDRIGTERYDICFVNHGELVSGALVDTLKTVAGGVLVYNSDNPFVGRDRRRWRIFLQALTRYDLVAVPRESSATAGRALGGRMTRVWFAADEVVHRARPFDAGDAARYGSDIAFVGTWMPERGPLVARLLDAGINVRVYGPRWHKAPEYARIRHAIADGGVLDDETYVRAVHYARVALGFVSSGNRDEHTTRSMEVPAIGTLLCAKRTNEHRELYVEDKEAIFWDDAEECAAKCRALLGEPGRIQAIAAAGAMRQQGSRHWNERLVESLLEKASGVQIARHASAHA